MIEIAKSKGKVVRIRKRLWRGVPLLDVRVFFLGADGKLQPSKQGLSIGLDGAGDLADAVRKVAGQEKVDAD